jgi:FKBP-type peptidyl-prolyl cis-trans isomerase
MKHTRVFYSAIALAVLTTTSLVATAAMETDKQKLGYTFGFQMAQNLVQQGISGEVDHEAMVAAIADVLAGRDLQMTDEEMQASFVAFQQQVQQENQLAGNNNQTASDAFLAGNKGKEGVMTTDSGLQYKIETEGAGDAPTPSSTVVVHYSGTLIDGTKFDSSYDRGEPAEFPLNGVIRGWQEGLLLMKAGAKYEFYIPPELAYGANAPGSIGPNQALVFTVELLEIL